MEQRKPKERGLGRGLDALFGDEEKTIRDDAINNQHIASSGRKLIGVAQIKPNPDQPRRYFDEAALEELAASIREHGLLQPILVRPIDGGQYEIVAGERRWRASQRAQLHEVPVVIRELNDAETYQIALVENLQREDLNPIEEALGYQKLIDDFNETPESVGRVVGKSRSHVSNMVRILALPDDVLGLVRDGLLSAGHARALLGADNPYVMAAIIMDEGLSVRQTEKMVAEGTGRAIKKRGGGQQNAEKKSGLTQKDASHLALEKQMSDMLGLHVTINTITDTAGKLIIEYRTLDQFDDVLRRLTHHT